MSASDAHRPAQDRGPEDEFDLDLDLDLDFGVEEPQPQPQPQSQPEPVAFESSPFELDLGSEPIAEEVAPSGLQPAAFEGETLDFTDEAPDGAYARPEEAAGAPPFEAEGYGDDGYGDDGYADGAPGSGFDADALDIEFDKSDQDTGSSRPRGVVAAAAVAGALMAAALAVVAPRSAPSDEVSIVAQAPAQAAPDGEPSSTDAPPIDAPSTEVTATDAGASESAEPATELAEPSYLEPFEGEPAFEEPSFDLAEPVAEPGLPVAGEVAAGEVVGADEDASRATRTAELDVLEQVLLPEDRTGVEFVSPDEMDDIWLDEELPPGGVAARVHRLTPRVGPVRLITNLGEVFEGELYSIGAGELSLSNHLGRMSFSARQVQSVERLPHLGAEGLDGVGGDLPGVRVRVRVPGGWIYGRLLAEDQGRVTLLTDSGGQVTLDADGVQRVGEAQRGAFPSEDQEGIDEALRGESK